MEDDENKTKSIEVWVGINGTQVGGADDPEGGGEALDSVVVDLDLNQPDMCAVTVRNQGHTHSNERALGDEIEVKIGGSGGTTIFKGELVGLEPFYKTGEQSKCVIRAYNRMHRLLRGRKSRTFLDQTDQKIAGDVAKDAGLSADCGSDPTITHKHVYQHNQTNLEFLRVRAARIGFEVWVEDKKLYFKKREVDRDSGIELKLEDAEADNGLTTFAPRLSSAGVVKEVKVLGWDPEKKEKIEGKAKVSGSQLGSKDAAKASSTFGDSVSFEVDHPIFSKDEAEAIAKARLAELAMDYITGEASCMGNPALKPGIVVKLTVNPDKSDDRFNGKYFVVGATHVYKHAGGESGGGGGYKTTLRVRRDAEKG